MMTTEYETHTVSERGGAFQPWSEALARRIAREDGLGELGEVQWRVIRTLREHFVQYGALPPMSLACGMNRLAPGCVDELFRGEDELRLLAGLPEPGAEAIGDL